MKRTRWFMAAMVMVMVLAMAMTAALAEPPPLYGFAVPGTGTSSARSNAIVSANSINGGPAVITYLNATGGNADNVVTIYVPTGTNAIVTAANSTTSLPISGYTNQFATSQVVVVRHRSNDSYEWRNLDGTTPLQYTNLVATANWGTSAAGDVVYAMQSVGQITVGTSKELNMPTGGIFAQYPGPVLLLQSGTSVGVTGIGVVSGYYVKP